MNYESFNRGGPNSDQHQFSHNNKQIYTLSQEKVVRINKTITKINEKCFFLTQAWIAIFKKLELTVN